MVLRRALQIAVLVFFVGILAAEDKVKVGVIDKVNEKGKSISFKEGKAKTGTNYAILKETDIFDEKGKRISPRDLSTLEGKEVTLTLVETTKGTAKTTTLSMIKLGRPEDMDEKKDDKRAARKDDSKAKAETSGKPDAGGRGTEYTIVSVDAGKGEIVVESGGSKTTIRIADDTKFIGPKGGDRGEGKSAFEDNDNPKVLRAGFKIRVYSEKNKVREIYLPYQNSVKE